MPWAIPVTLAMTIWRLRDRQKMASATSLTSAQVFAKAIDAVVDVEGISVLDFGEETAFVYRVAGSGFFTDGRFIVTAAVNVILPTPEVIPQTTLIREPRPVPGATVIRANRIYVRVHGECSFLYEAILVGVDPAANIAVLRIDQNLLFNKDRPCLEKAVFLKWGKSLKYPTGSPIYNIGNAEQSVPQFSGGYVRNNKNVDVRFKYYESLDTDLPFFDGLIGSPLLDYNGNVVGVATGRTSNINDDQITFHDPTTPGQVLQDSERPDVDPINNEADELQDDLRRKKGAQQEVRGLLFGVPEHVVKRIVRKFIKADTGKCTKRVHIQVDPVGNFFVYEKGWLNMHVELVTTNSWLNRNLIIEDTGAGSTPTFELRVPQCGEISGYYVRCINPASPLFNVLSECDIITEVACHKVGQCGIGFYTILWRFNVGDTVRLTYYKQSEDYAVAHCVMVKLEDIFVDYPLESLQVFQFFNPAIPNGFDWTPLCGPFNFSDGFIGGGALGNPGDPCEEGMIVFPG